jgi:KUP system potassium uptake protein
MTDIPHTDLAEAHGAHSHRHPLGVAAAVGALGIVFGDIGTSPLYALQAALQATGHALPQGFEVTGIVSLIFWALTFVVSIKYVAIVLRADNDGEGGILALASLVMGKCQGKKLVDADDSTSPQKLRLTFVLVLGVLGAALLYGDGAITPAISVLSAMEGLKVQAPSLETWVIPGTLVILVALFAAQRRGTGHLGKLFGPIMTLWFAVIALMGIYGIAQAPQILAALNPLSAIRFLAAEPGVAFVVFGAVFLALTGAEALYADLGHFGAKPIRLAWFAVAYPALILNYMGQGALLLNHPDATDNPFFKLAPELAVLPLVVLATLATVIASQALISGVFSLTRQAITMRLLPRMTIISTSGEAYGQIYVGLVNWLLMLATLLIVLSFHSSANLASAYGIAVSGTMLVTTLLLYRVMAAFWNWPGWVALGLTVAFALIDFGFLSANAMKFFDGGWLPLAIGGFVAFLMIAFREGTLAVQQRLAENSIPFNKFLSSINDMTLLRLPGTGIFVTRLEKAVSPMLVHQIEHNRVLHEHVILLTLEPTKRPRVRASERLTIRDLGNGIWSVKVKLGFMQRPDIPTALRGCSKLGLKFLHDDLHYYIAHESLVRRSQGERLPGIFWFAFHFMHRMGLRAADYFNLPPRKVIEVGFRVEI